MNKGTDGHGEVPADLASPPFRVLAVCVGNVCRSPATERLIGLALGDGAGVEVTSAGTRALVGHAIAEPMAELLRAHGADPAGFAARQLTAPMVERADLVLTMSREVRSTVVTLHPPSLRRTFTLRELAALLRTLEPEAIDINASEPTPAARLRAIVPLAIEGRGRLGPRRQDDDVVDPWRRSTAVYRRSMEQIVDAVEDLAGVMANGRGKLSLARSRGAGAERGASVPRPWLRRARRFGGSYSPR